MLQCAHEVARVQQAAMGAGVQLGGLAAHLLHVQFPIGQIHLEQRGDFQLSARRGRDLPRPPWDNPVEEVKPRHSVLRWPHLRLFDNGAGGAALVEIDHAIAFGIEHAIAEDGALDLLRTSLPWACGGAWKCRPRTVPLCAERRKETR